MNVTLVAVDSDGKARDAVMKRARLLIGRREGCDIRIPVASVSREHCELRVEDGKLIARDMGSSNGTYINKQRIQEQQVSAGDLISVGPAVFVAQIEGNPATIDATKAFNAGSAPQPAASASGPASRPASPTAQTRAISPPPAKPPSGAKPAAKPKSLMDDDDDDMDLRKPGKGAAKSGDSSVSDLDFDFLDEDDEDKKKL